MFSAFRSPRGFVAVLVATLLVVGVSAAAGEESIVFKVRQERGAALIEARAEIAASGALVWQTLTDYDHFAEFIPGLKESKVIGREGPAAIVEQHGEMRVLLLKFPIDVTLASTEHPPGGIDVTVLRGNLRRLDGGYRIEPLGPDTVVLRWDGVIEPGWMMPPLIGAQLLRPVMRAQFVGMVEEIRRRAGAQAKLPEEE